MANKSQPPWIQISSYLTKKWSFEVDRFCIFPLVSHTSLNVRNKLNYRKLFYNILLFLYICIVRICFLFVYRSVWIDSFTYNIKKNFKKKYEIYFYTRHITFRRFFFPQFYNNFVCQASNVYDEAYTVRPASLLPIGQTNIVATHSAMPRARSDHQRHLDRTPMNAKYDKENKSWKILHVFRFGFLNKIKIRDI